MTTLDITPSPSTVPAPAGALTPGIGRRIALVATGFLTLALPTVFTINLARMLLTGVESEHRFHQATGQGLVLTAIWLGGLLPLLVAGWRGRTPSTTAGLRHLVLVVAGAICATAAHGGGAPMLLAVIGVPGALLWWALPRRPRLRMRFEIDALLAPVALAVTAFLAPYAVDQLALQNHATGYHAQNPHFFDMAWVSVILMVFAVLAACFRPAQALLGWVAGSLVVFGAAGLAFGEGLAWSAGALALGAAAAAALGVCRRAAARAR